MELEQLRDFCLTLPNVTWDFPFDEHTLVFRVETKVFLLCNVTSCPLRFNAKCDPERAIELRSQYNAIQPGYHMSKKHWNTIISDGSVPLALQHELIVHAWELIVAGLPRARREPLLAARAAQQDDA